MSKKDTPTREVTATSEYGKPLYGKLVTITCAKRGCKVKRTIKTQDRFQVKFCREHQKEHADERRRARAKAKREAEAKKKPKAKAPTKPKAPKRNALRAVPSPAEQRRQAIEERSDLNPEQRNQLLAANAMQAEREAA
jgi:hypothetical protein